MENKYLKEFFSILLAAVVLSVSLYYKNTNSFWFILLYISITIGINVLTKKIAGYYYETNIEYSLWSIQNIGFRPSHKLKTPFPMTWLPLIVSFVTNGFFQWIPILVFNVEPKPERASKRHGLYNFSEVSERDLAIIVFVSVICHLFFSVVFYLCGFEILAKYNIYYAVASIIPLSDLDGSKLFFGNKILWFISTILSVLFFMVSFGF
jgi:hypothetical protein